MEQIEFDSYQIKYYSTDLNGKQAEIICCKHGRGQDIIEGRICFWKDKLPPSEFKEEEAFKRKLFHLNFDISRFDNVIQMLRYGKPITVDYNESNKTGWLLTEFILLHKKQSQI